MNPKLNPLDPDLVAEQAGQAKELRTAQEALEAIEEIKNCRKGWPYLQARLEDKAEDFKRIAIEGKTVEERETARLVYLKFREEIIPMLDVDESNHLRTVENSG